MDDDYGIAAAGNRNDLNLPTWEPRSKVDLASNAVEASKGCTTFCVSRWVIVWHEAIKNKTVCKNDAFSVGESAPTAAAACSSPSRPGRR